VIVGYFYEHSIFKKSWFDHGLLSGGSALGHQTF
jgi:hypothetical protein